ncbi:thiamine phosphate synthase [Zunongwangia endophytica]|uniref:Thiamine-phosphate synthase n=1 Tax=Zunongwangia endophytica TaxID=1808945 RepID=A0ABV8H9L1_9FLAO|nr:thiamine phosphate synthase [Zunongwangia endophytica]MDN3593747.1 thiamine phosphate synthase [Zunongwangia endophytica]
MHPDFPYQLYLVISEESSVHHSLLKVAEMAIEGGVDIIQLREKNLNTSDFIKKAEKLKKLTDRYNIPLIINDNLEVANAVDAFGIHVGNSDTPPSEIQQIWNHNKAIGYSIEYLEQLETEQTKIANHLGISPVYSTSTKTNTVTEWGIEGIKKIRNLTKKPLVAIGRMNASNAAEVIKAGADCIAVVSAICAANDPKEAAKEIKNQIQNHQNENI